MLEAQQIPEVLKWLSGCTRSLCSLPTHAQLPAAGNAASHMLPELSVPPPVIRSLTALGPMEARAHPAKLYLSPCGAIWSDMPGISKKVALSLSESSFLIFSQHHLFLNFIRHAPQTQLIHPASLPRPHFECHWATLLPDFYFDASKTK